MGNPAENFKPQVSDKTSGTDKGGHDQKPLVDHLDKSAALSTRKSEQLPASGTIEVTPLIAGANSAVRDGAHNPVQNKEDGVAKFEHDVQKGFSDIAEKVSHLGQKSPEQVAHEQAEELKRQAEEREKHEGQSVKDAAKTGNLVWKTGPDGVQHPEAPYNPFPPANEQPAGPMEALAYARYLQANSSSGYFHASKGDSLDGKRVE